MTITPSIKFILRTILHFIACLAMLTYGANAAQSVSGINITDTAKTVVIEPKKLTSANYQNPADYKESRALSNKGSSRISPLLLWSLFIVCGALLIAIAFIVSLTTIVRKKTEGLNKYSKELEKSEEQFRLAMDASRDGFWDWNLTTDEFYFSPGYFRILGFIPDELPQQFSTWSDRIHPDDYKSTINALTECIEGSSEGFRAEFRMLTKNGLWVWLLGRWAAVEQRDDGSTSRIIGTLTEISGLVNAQAALRSSEERLALAVSAAHLGIWDLNLQNSELTWNGRMYEIYDVKESDQKVDKYFWENLIHEDNRDELFDKLNSALKYDRFFDAEYKVRLQNDKTRFIRTFATIIRDDGAATRIIGVDIDVTERRLMEQQIRQSQKMDAVGKLAGGIAHDFNNKLTVILGYADLIRMLECECFTKCESFISEIIKAAHHSQEITRKLLAFSREESLETCKVDINYMLVELGKTLGRLLSEQISIRYIHNDERLLINMNPSEYDQIIMNLTLNARDAMPDGGEIIIATYSENVTTTLIDAKMAAEPGEYVVTAIIDNGVGISEDDAERIFDPFFTTKEQGKGTGLGLSTVYNIIARNKGFIAVSSVLGRGTEFRVYLPILREDNNQMENLVELETLKGHGRILLVEDEEQVRILTQLFLESLGYSVLAPLTPIEAVNLCEDPETKIDIVLSDVIMPAINGKQLKEKISLIRPNLPFIFMSGYTSDIISEQGVLEQGAHFIRKPINFKQLHDKLTQLMETANS